MKNKPYSVVGNRENGFRIAVPTETGAKAGDKFDFFFYEGINDEHKLPPGALVYVPAKRFSSDGEPR